MKSERVIYYPSSLTTGVNPPFVTIDLVVKDRVPDLYSENFDVAISLSPPKEDCFISRNIDAMYSTACYVHLTRKGTPHVPADLIKHECLTPGEMPMELTDTWAFEGPYGAVQCVHPFSSAGATPLSKPFAQAWAYVPDDTNGWRRLINVLPAYRLASQGIHAFYPEHLSENVCVRSWIGHLSSFSPKLLATSV